MYSEYEQNIEFVQPENGRNYQLIQITGICSKIIPNTRVRVDVETFETLEECKTRLGTQVNQLILLVFHLQDKSFAFKF